MFDRENTEHQLVDSWVVYNCRIVNISFHIYRIWGLLVGLALLLDYSSWLPISSREDILDKHHMWKYCCGVGKSTY